jgi:hypothetical protein
MNIFSLFIALLAGLSDVDMTVIFMFGLMDSGLPTRSNRLSALGLTEAFRGVGCT